MRHKALTLVADGSSDSVLIPVIEWVIRVNRPDLAFRIEMAERVGAFSDGLSRRVQNALRRYPCDVLIVHRDSEGMPLDDRRREIDAALDDIGGDYVKVVPVRMSEAWLIGNESAIRIAAGNPNGQVRLNLPRRRNWESDPDPKAVLFRALRDASELSGRRLRSFSPEERRHRVASLINDYSFLRGLASFDVFERELVEALLE